MNAQADAARFTTNETIPSHGLFIDGCEVGASTAEGLEVLNPATGEVIAQAAEGDKKDIDRAVRAARTAFETGRWSQLTPSERGRFIWKLADLLEDNLEEFAELESLDNGKPLKIARVADVPLAVDLLRYMAGPRCRRCLPSAPSPL